MHPLRVAAAAEAATGVALTVSPGLVVQLLFGADVAGAGLAVARVAGIALVALGVACWPDGVTGGGARRAHLAMLVYNALVAVFLGLLAVSGELRGPLLVPAVVVHVVVAGIMARILSK